MRRILIFLIVLSFYSIQTNAQAYQWAKQFAANYSIGTDVVTDNNLNVISSGWFNDSVDLDPGPNTHWVYESAINSSYNAYLSKLDQNGSFVWGFSYEDGSQTGYTRIYAIDVDNQDNIIVMGQFRDSVDLDFGVGVFKLYDNNNNNSYLDNIFIAKYDPSGNFIWGKGLHSSNTVNGYGIWGHSLKVDANNDVVLSGHFRDTVDFDPGPGVYNLVGNFVSTSTYYGNKFLLKLSSAGNFIWVRDWAQSGNWNNNNGWYGGNELDVDANNNIFFPIVYTDSFDADPLLPISMAYSNGLRDVSLLKVSPTGTMLWHKEIGGPNHDYCNSLATDPSGNIFYSIGVAGNTAIDMDPGPGVFMVNWVNNNWGKVILKLDNNGNFIWALKNLDHNWGSGWYGEGIATDTSGSLYLTTRINAGWNTNQFDLNPGPNAYLVTSNGLYDIAFQNLDGNGNFVWGGVMGGVGNDLSTDICTDKNRGVYLTGWFHQTADFDPTPDTSFMTHTHGSTDAFVVKLNNCNVAKSTVYQACDSVVYNSQVFYHDTAWQAHYPAWNGCDSAHATVIDVKTFTNDTLVVDTCKYYFWNGNTYTTTGVYTHNYGLPSGCDSTITLVLTIDNGSVQSINLSDCDSASFNGVSYNVTGQYTQLYNNTFGCDSNFIINFTKTAADTSITVAGPANLVANATSATYQWINCSNLQPILGETNVFFNASVSGSYACVVTQNGCTDTSSCYNLEAWPNAIQEYNILSKVYPNPSKGSYHLELDKEYKNVQLEIRSMSGQLVWKKNFKQLKETNINIEKAAGVYMLYIKQGERAQVKKLLKW